VRVFEVCVRESFKVARNGTIRQIAY